MSKGNTALDVSENEDHWFYTGDWKFYDEKRNLLGINTYEKGTLIDQIEIKN